MGLQACWGVFNMRCRCCDKRLSDFEATRKNIHTNEYLDMCNKCYSTIDKDILAYERYDLYDEEETDESNLGFNFGDMDIGLDK
jgi:hypothetical protein